MKSRQSRLAILIITLLFIIFYFLMRFIPNSECGFLHYEEKINKNGVAEFCATNSAGFIDLTKLDFPIDLIIDWDPISFKGEISLRMKGGHFLLPHELIYTHTKKIHLLLIDESLSDYHHLHPDFVDLNNKYTFDFRPKNSGHYSVYAEIVPRRTKRQLIASNQLNVEGIPSSQNFNTRYLDLKKDLKFELIGIPDRPKAKKDYKISLNITGVNGTNIELEEIMGAKAHMVVFDSNLKGYAHMHPLSINSTEDSNNEELQFLFNVPDTGWFRLFAQVQKNGEAVYAHFDIKVE